MRKAVAISMVKNEADIIESFVRYHLNIFDGLYILDNGSTDRTAAIVEQLAAEGLPVYLMADETIDFAQSKKMTMLLYQAFVDQEPDIIMPLDADEFVIASNNRDHPRHILERIDLDRIYSVQTRQYVPLGSDPKSELLIPKRIVHTYGDVNLFKAIATKPLLEQYVPVLSGGNHYLQFEPSAGVREVKEDLGSLRLAHFAFRSLEQAKSKVMVGWLNNLANPAKKPDDCFHWEYWFNLIKSEGLDYETIGNLIQDFYGDAPSFPQPIDLSFCGPLELKYTGPSEVNALTNYLNYCEALAQAYAKLKRGRME